MLLRRFARTPITRYGLPLLVALVLAVLPTALRGAPEPTAHDEYGYLLGGETFAEGRLTNPTHPHWRHFETIHQLQRPSYQSKYPPAQSLFLAAGQRLWHPIVGVWLSVALMVLALVWMLDAYVPRRWSLVGGLIAATQFVILGRAFGGGPIGYWSQSYWGGAVAALGGALLYGALPRIVRAQGSPRDRFVRALAMGAGLALLSASRPKEGLICALPAAGVMAVWLWRGRTATLRGARLQVVAVLVMILALGGVGLAIYHRAVTGDALRLPWLEHYDQYCAFPLAVWAPAREGVVWTSPQLAGWYGGVELAFSMRYHSPGGFLSASVDKLGRFWIFFVGPVLTPALFFLAGVLRRPWMRLAALACALTLLNNLLTIASFPHYSAPLVGPILLLLVQGLRHLRLLRLGGRRLGGPICAALAVLFCATAVHGLVTAVRENPLAKRHRPRVQRELEELGGRHLVFMRYGPGHDPTNEWVFNRADIDAAAVVWARERSGPENRALMAHLPTHRVWVVEITPGEPERLLEGPPSMADARQGGIQGSPRSGSSSGGER